MSRSITRVVIGQFSQFVSSQTLPARGIGLLNRAPIKCKLRVACVRFLLFLFVFVIFNSMSNERDRYAKIYQQKNELIAAIVETHIFDRSKSAFSEKEIRQYMAGTGPHHLLANEASRSAQRMLKYGALNVRFGNSPHIKTQRAKNDDGDYKNFMALMFATEMLIRHLDKKQIPSIQENTKIMANDVYAKRIADRILQAASTTRATARNQENGYLEKLNTVIKMSGLLSDQNENVPQLNVSYHQPLLPGQTSKDNLVITTENRLAKQKPLGVQLLAGGRGGSGSRSESDLIKLSGRQKYEFCRIIPKQLVGKVFVNANHSHNMTRKDVETDHRDLLPGGIWQPPDCVARHRVAIIIPYRDREQHLVLLLSHLLPILKRQQLNFEIFVIEQKGNDTFNKARIMNAAFKEAIKIYDFQCFVFHDVDLLPEDDRNMYSCPQQPRHMSVAIDEMNYKVPYEYLVGGVLSMRTEHFQKVNGYSNLYWGWGAEDDDMAFRIMHVGLKITRPPSMVARYKMIKHEKRKPTDWRKRTRLLRTGTRRFNFDGLNSVNYDLISIKKERLFTHILVEIGKPPGVS